MLGKWQRIRLSMGGFRIWGWPWFLRGDGRGRRSQSSEREMTEADLKKTMRWGSPNPCSCPHHPWSGSIPKTGLPLALLFVTHPWILLINSSLVEAPVTYSKEALTAEKHLGKALLAWGKALGRKEGFGRLATQLLDSQQTLPREDTRGRLPAHPWGRRKSWSASLCLTHGTVVPFSSCRLEQALRTETIFQTRQWLIAKQEKPEC